jgi:hypothetical protein
VRPKRGCKGQAAVELALVLPVLAVLLLAVVQVALVVRDQVLVVHAAREGARAAAVDPSPAAARRAAAGAGPLEPARIDVRLGGGRREGEPVQVSVAYRSPTVVPLVGPLLPDVSLHGRASMRVESGPAEASQFRPERRHQGQTRPSLLVSRSGGPVPAFRKFRAVVYPEAVRHGRRLRPWTP